MTQRKIDPTKVTLEPAPTRSKTTSQARTNARALRAWARGEQPALIVSFRGRVLTKEEIDWDKLPRESTAKGGPTAPPRSVRLSAERTARLAQLAAWLGLSQNETVGVAIDRMFSAESEKRSG